MKFVKQAFNNDLYLALMVKIISLCTLIFIVVYFFFGLYKEQNTYAKIIKEKAECEKIINEIRQNSEDLTRLARLYTNTKDSLFRDQYFEVLNINKGQAPRPEKFNRIYWNVLTTKDHREPPFTKRKNISANKLIDDASFDDRERAAIKKALQFSFALTNLEMESFLVLEGNTAIGEMPNQEKAVSMVNSEHYHTQIISIMEQLNKAYNLLETRVENNLNGLNKKINKTIILIAIIFVVIVLTMLNIIASASNLKKETISQLKISVEEKTEELTALNTSKNLFFSIIAHDLKGPFNSLIGFSDVLYDQVKVSKNEGLLESVEIIKNVSQNTFELLQNLLEWAQMQSGRLEFNRENIRIDQVINDVLKVLALQSKQKNITINVSIDQPDTLVYADKNMISTVLRNLISNAVKYSYKNSSIDVTCSVENHAVKISVADQGVGITKEALENLFKTKYAQKTLGTSGEKGTGIGLILSKDFIEKHNGSIWVESELGKGSTFIFTIPFV